MCVCQDSRHCYQFLFIILLKAFSMTLNSTKGFYRLPHPPPLPPSLPSIGTLGARKRPCVASE